MRKPLSQTVAQSRAVNLRAALIRAKRAALLRSETDHKKCKRCRSEIPADALRCPVCQAEQDWRAFIGVSSTSIALLVALISVTTVFWDVVKDLVVADYGAVSVDVLYADFSPDDEKPISIDAVLNHQGSKTTSVILTELTIDAKGFSDEEYPVSAFSMTIPLYAAENASGGDSIFRVMRSQQIQKECPRIRFSLEFMYEHDEIGTITDAVVKEEMPKVFSSEPPVCKATYRHFDGKGTQTATSETACRFSDRLIASMIESCDFGQRIDRMRTLEKNRSEQQLRSLQDIATQSDAD